MSLNQPSPDDPSTWASPKFTMVSMAMIAAQTALVCRGKFPEKMVLVVMPPHPNYWSFDQEHPEVDQEGVRLYNASQTKKDYDDWDPAVITPASRNFKCLWKVCLRVFRTSPTRMISPNNELRYRPTPPPGVKASHVVFTPKFSRLLTELVVHPCWEGKSHRFILALQYAVKVRVDDREHWPDPDSPELSCPALKHLDDTFWDLDLDPAPHSIHEMHRQARQAQTEEWPSVFSDFIYFLGEKAKMFPSSGYGRTYLGVPALPVTTKDLEILTDAVETFEWPENSWNASPAEIYDAFKLKGGLSSDQFPHNNEEMKEFVRRGLIDIYRTISASRTGIFARPNLTDEVPADNEILPGEESDV
ncbi:hypothetical protein IL306_013514 [Fusarium sp. DS 682]|nr:hypothetical protein IL306_013514 [Fusarium sp. DS 682]